MKRLHADGLSVRGKWLSAAALAGLSLLGACGGEYGEFETEGGVAQSEETIVSGSDLFDRQEVVFLDLDGGFGDAQEGHCTATLIGSGAFVTAAHCINFQPRYTGSATITIHASATSSQTESVSSIYSFGNALGRQDIAIGFLNRLVPRGWDWGAPLHYREYPSSLWTKIGYGCIQRSGSVGAGVKRYREGSGTGTAYNCPGDSGGPLLAGSLFDQGGVAMVMSGIKDGKDVDAYADPVWLEGMQREFSNPARGRGYESGVDRPGFDIRTISGLDAAPCRNECIANASCQAFTVTFQNGGSTCFLKSAAASADPLPRDIVSGVKEGYGTFDLPGGDLFVRSEPSVEACEAYCARNSNCRAFSYTSAGDCWVKDRANALRASTTVQSGAARSFEANVDRPGMDLRNFASTSATACSQSCVADKNCDAFSYTGGRCWLKQGIPPAVALNGVTSGLRRGIEFNSSRDGVVFRSFDLGNEPLRRCQTDCAADSSCLAWSAAVPAGKTNGQRLCKLMNTVGNRVRTNGSISGRKGLDFF
jgi:hypothetical protein